MSNSLILFCICQIINVVFSTFKYVLTVKASPMIAALSNALSYTIGAMVTYLLVTQDPIYIIIITFFSNIIGVPLGRAILDKFEKEKLWVYHATIRVSADKAARIRSTLKKYCNIHSTFEEIAENELYSMKFFAYNKNDSKTIKKVLEKYKAKYYIVEPK